MTKTTPWAPGREHPMPPGSLELNSLPYLQREGAPSKTALVLAGGGLTGAVYEIGALRAIDELLVERTVNDFDVIVGTSAGALVGSMLAKGISPGEMMTIVDGSHPGLKRIQPEHLFSLNAREFLRRSIRLPNTAKKALLHYLRHRSDMNLFDVFWSLIEALPSGLYDNKALERFVTQSLQQRGLSTQFDDVNGELYIIATDLDTGERVVFGREPWDDIPVGKAVAASSAVPLLYRPVRIGNREFVDGGLRGTASLDLAIEAGAKLIVCINPLVPIDHSSGGYAPWPDDNEQFISDKGFQAVSSQILRIMLQSGLAYHIKQLRHRHPDVDIILIEPRRDDLEMAAYNIMRYSTRVTVAQHGFESVTVDLANQYHELKATLARHGIEITRRFVISELLEMQEHDYDIEVVRRMLERSERRRHPRAGRRPSATDSLKDALAELQDVLSRLEQASVREKKGA